MSGRVHSFVFVAGFLLLAGLAAPTSALPDDGVESGITAEYQEGEVLVRLAPETDPARLGPGAEQLFGRWYRVLTNTTERAVDAVERFDAEPFVEVVELNRIWRLDPTPSQKLDVVSPAAVTPNDPFYSYQWHLPAIEAGDAWEVADVGAAVNTGVAV